MQTFIAILSFVVAAVVGSRQFPGISHNNKKDGRKDAAEQAIRMLIAEGQYHLPSQVSVVGHVQIIWILAELHLYFYFTHYCPFPLFTLTVYFFSWVPL